MKAMDAAEIARELIAEGAVAVVRLNDGARLRETAEALREGGVRAIELTMTTPGALAAVAELAWRDEMVIGVGSVTDESTARAAIEAGAAFVVSPVFEPSVVGAVRAAGRCVAAGAMTPTEALAAHRSGADFVKVFPAQFFGPAYVRAMLAPLPFLRLMPTGGVTPDNAGEWLDAGAAAVGVGSALVGQDLVDRGAWEEITRRARRLRASVDASRAASGGGVP